MRLIAAAPAALLATGIAAAQLPATAPSLQALKDAASSGAPQAEFALAEAYRTGAGTLKDPNQAILLYKKAAAQGHQPSADALGLLLFVNGDRKTAVPLLQAAAGRGNPRALYVLGTAHFNGDTVPKDRALAYAELTRAAASLPAAQRNLDLVTRYLTPDELARGRTLAAQPTLPPPTSVAATAPLARPGATTIAQPTRPLAAAVPPQPARPAYAASPSALSSAATTAPAPTRSASATSSVWTPPPRAVPAAPPFARPASAAASASPPHAPPLAGAAAVGGWRVQLGAYSTPARAELQWQSLVRRVAALAPLHHVVTPAGALTRLQANGLHSSAEAAQLCRDVAATGQGCFPVAP